MSESDHENVVASAADAVDLFVPGIKAAVRELEEKHGPLTLNLLRAYAIAQRESGEVADAILALTRPLNITPTTDPNDAREVVEYQTQHLAHEIAQVIAVHIYMLVNLFGDRVSSGSTEPPILVPGPSKVQ